MWFGVVSCRVMSYGAVWYGIGVHGCFNKRLSSHILAPHLPASALKFRFIILFIIILISMPIIIIIPIIIHYHQPHNYHY